MAQAEDGEKNSTQISDSTLHSKCGEAPNGADARESCLSRPDPEWSWWALTFSCSKYLGRKERIWINNMKKLRSTIQDTIVLVWGRFNAKLTMFLTYVSPLVMRLLLDILPSGERRMENGEWRMGEWENGEWERANLPQGGVKLKPQLLRQKEGARRDDAMRRDIPHHLLHSVSFLARAA